MLLEKPIFHKRTESAIAQLRREDIEPTPEDILWLNHAAGKCIRPCACDELQFINPPCPCGNTLLWPLSIGARIWLERVGKPQLAGTGDLEKLGIAFAMAHSREPDFLNRYTGCWLTRIAVARWAAGLNATKAEIFDAVARAFSPEDVDLVNVEFKGERKNVASDYGDVLALLCHFIKTDPEFWMWQASESYAAAMLRKISTALPGDRSISDDHAKFVAISQFNLVMGEIRANHKKHPSDQSDPSKKEPPLSNL